MMQQETDYRRILIAIFLSGILLISWQALVEYPRRQHLGKLAVQKERIQEKEKLQTSAKLASKESAEYNPSLTRKERLALSPRLTIESATLDGSIALKGARFDDLKLANYHVDLDPTSPEVRLFSPQGDKESYFVQVGWLSPDANVKLPDQHSLWKADKDTLAAGQTARLTWDNGSGLTFVLLVSLDEHYMFTINQRMENHSGRAVTVMPYAYINRTYTEEQQHYIILHEGPLGVMEGVLQEIQYEELRDKGKKEFESTSGWLGITDKYWQSALIPGPGTFKSTFSHYSKDGFDRYQTDYLGESEEVASGSTSEHKVRLFAGAKEIRVLDRYTEGDPATGAAPIVLFDRSVDFGTLYFMTKPMFLTLNFFFTHIGNFGIAIMLLTILIKFLMYPLANKSYKAMARMRVLQPEITKLRERYGDDHIKLNQEMIALYKREKVNPASGCLPMLVQMPVFFALYKVLFVTIEMRHAPFFLWIKDLSALDPSNLFTLFGLLPWSHPAWMHLGVLPMLMCATMVIQMRQQPKPPDPVQAKVMAYMPYFFLIIFATFPAGLVLYWVWSNILSILQQHIITKRHGGKETPAKSKAKA